MTARRMSPTATNQHTQKADTHTMVTPIKSTSPKSPARKAKTPTQKATATQNPGGGAKSTSTATRKRLAPQVPKVMSNDTDVTTAFDTPEKRLSKKIPSPVFATDYVHRTIDGALDTELLAYARTTKENVILFGPTGSGKTGVIYAYAAEHKTPIANIPCNGAIDPATLFGRPAAFADGSIGYIESDVTLIMRHGGIIYLDEINFAPMRVMSVLHGCLDARRQITIPELGYETFDLSPDCQFIANNNPGYEDTKPLNKAFNNRFSVPLEWGYDADVESQLITVLPTLLEVADKVRARIDAGDLDTPLGTNKLREFEDHALDLTAMFGPDNGMALATRMLVNGFKAHEREAVDNAITHFSARLKNEAAEAIAAESTGGES